MSEKHVIWTDASHADDHAGIAAVVDERLLFLDVIECPNSSIGERAALLKAMRICRTAGWDQVVFKTDDRQLQRLWPDLDKSTGWTISIVPRRFNTAAHTIAKEGLKVWLAGAEGRPTMDSD